RIPGLGIQHAPAEVEDNPLLVVIFLNQNRGDGSVTHGQIHIKRPVLPWRNQNWRLRQVFLDFVESLLLLCPPVKFILELDLHQTHEQLDTPRQIGDKSSDKVDFSDELLKLLRNRRLHCLYRLLTLQADLDSRLMHQESYELTG